MLHGILCGIAVRKLECLHLIEVLAACGNSGIEDFLGHGNEVLTSRHKVGLALHSDHSSESRHLLGQKATVGGYTVGALSGDGESTLAKELLSLFEIAVSFGERFLHVGKSGSGHGTELLDIFN